MRRGRTKIRQMCSSAALALAAAGALSGSVGAQAAPGASGGFRVVGYGQVQNSELSEFREYVRGERVLEQWTEGLNDWIALPTVVGLAFAECGVANAYYDPELSRVTMCYELVSELSSAFETGSEEPMTDEERTEAVLGATDFIFYHEIGHALLDVLELPTLGRNEDAADGLAAYVLIDAEDDGEGGGELAAVHGVAGLLGLQGDREKLTDVDFADEHSLSEQRFYNVICLIYGSDPATYAELVTDGTLPQARAARCQGEYQTLNRDWGRLLERWVREDG